MRIYDNDIILEEVIKGIWKKKGTRVDAWQGWA